MVPLHDNAYCGNCSHVLYYHMARASSFLCALLTRNEGERFMPLDTSAASVDPATEPSACKEALMIPPLLEVGDVVQG